MFDFLRNFLFDNKSKLTIKVSKDKLEANVATSVRIYFDVNFHVFRFRERERNKVYLDLTNS